MSRKYRKVWESESEFSGWLSSLTGDDTKAFCKLCKCSLQPHKKDLRNHMNTKKHQEAFKFSENAAKSSKITKFMPSKISHRRKIAELKIAAFIAEHCSFNAVDHLGNLIKTLDEGSLVLQDIKLHRTKCIGLIKNVLAPCLLQNLIQNVGDSYYSIIIDESTAIDTKKMLCLMIRYFSQSQKQIKTEFYRLVEIEAGNAITLTTCFKKCLNEDGLNINKLIGIGVDGANVMVGANHSFSSLLRTDVPDLIVVKCVCHSLHLAAEHSCKMLPRHLDFMVKESHNWFSCSSKRQIEYRTLYNTLTNKDPLKIDKLSGTRWLARYEAITKILEQWDALKLHFQLAQEKERCYTANQLHQMFSENTNKLYLTCLAYILKSLTDVNKSFQSENADNLKLLKDLNNLLYNYLRILIPPVRLEKIFNNKDDVSTFNFQNYVMDKDFINFGYAFSEVSSEMKQSEIATVKQRCKDFLVELCLQLQKRIPENLNLLEKIDLLSPEKATSQLKPDISDLVIRFKNVCEIDVDTAIDEWNVLHRQEWVNISTSESFWIEVSEKINSSGIQRYGSISKLALMLLSLPFSNASVERAFSVANIVKNKLRNRMSTTTAESVMRIRFSLNGKGGCQNFSPSDKMLQKFCSEEVYNVSSNVDDDINVIELFVHV